MKFQALSVIMVLPITLVTHYTCYTFTPSCDKGTEETDELVHVQRIES